MTLKAIFGIQYPIIQAPMAGVQGSQLAVAVSNSGGLGSLPCAMLNTSGLRSELEAIRAGTSKPYNVNFFAHVPPKADPEREKIWLEELLPFYKEFDINPRDILSGSGRTPFDQANADVLEHFKPPVISFHFGLPSKNLLERVRSWGAKVMSSATTVEEAIWLESHGIDVIIAQGLEAGGHRGIFLTKNLATQTPMRELLANVLKAVKLPVVAAGGISTAEQVADVLRMGAAGVQIGTAYLLCPESRTSEPHREALKSPAARNTVITNLFSGGPARGIGNRFIKECGPLSEKTPPFPLAGAAVAPLRTKAEADSSGDFSPLWAGQNASSCQEIPAAELTAQLGHLT